MIFIWFPHFFSFFFFSLSLIYRVPTRLQDSDGEKSDQDLVVDIANDTVSSKQNLWNQKKNQKIKKIEKNQKKLHNEESTRSSCDDGKKL